MNYNNIDLKGIRALFVDCDGTLADTMAAHNKAYELAFNLNGVPFCKDEHEKYAPFGGSILMEETVIAKGFSKSVADKIVRDKQSLLPICLKDFMKPNKGLIKLIKEVNVPTFVVTNGRRRSITQILEKIGLLYYTGGIICKEDCDKLKPNAEPYEKALKMVGMSSKEVIVFEDNLIGLESAKAAGIENIIMVDTEDFSYERI